jgi:hypothetical protein
MILRSITKTVSINAPTSEVFKFLANPANWPQWAIVNVKSIKEAEDEWWDMETPIGQAKLKMLANEKFGILDHEFVAPDASWTVPARVVPNAGGTEFMITFFQPPNFSNEFFDQQITLIDQEMNRLRKILEP